MGMIDGQPQAYLFDATPEPSSRVLRAIGATALLITARRRKAYPSSSSKKSLETSFNS